MTLAPQTLFDILDVDLAEKVAAYLVSLKSPHLQKLSVQVRSGVVTVRGKVKTFFEKQMVNLGQQRVPGIKQWIDELAVEGGQTFVPVAPPPRRSS